MQLQAKRRVMQDSKQICNPLIALKPLALVTIELRFALLQEKLYTEKMEAPHNNDTNNSNLADQHLRNDTTRVLTTIRCRRRHP